MNEHYAETANDITSKLGLLTTLSSDDITEKFHYFSMKMEKYYMEKKKTHKFQKMDQKNRSSDVIKLRRDNMFDLHYF